MDKKAYLEIVEKRKAERAEKGEALELKMPSGAVWKLLPVQLQQFTASGRLPANLIYKLRSRQNDATAKALTEDELFKVGLASLEMVREILLQNLIEPRISLEETDDTITPEQIDPEDFQYFSDYIFKGGQADAVLKSEPSLTKRKRAA